MHYAPAREEARSISLARCAAAPNSIGSRERKSTAIASQTARCAGVRAPFTQMIVGLARFPATAVPRTADTPVPRQFLRDSDPTHFRSRRSRSAGAALSAALPAGAFCAATAAGKKTPQALPVPRLLLGDSSGHCRGRQPRTAAFRVAGLPAGAFCAAAFPAADGRRSRTAGAAWSAAIVD